MGTNDSYLVWWGEGNITFFPLYVLEDDQPVSDEPVRFMSDIVVLDLCEWEESSQFWLEFLCFESYRDEIGKGSQEVISV